LDAVGVTRGSEKRNNMKKNVDPDGRVYFSVNANGKEYRYYEDEKITPTDVWADIAHMNQQDPERIGYATQKPLNLLKRIILASSDEGDIILDPFCGCATTLDAAQKLDREWIGIDVSYHAIRRVSQVRLQDRLGLVEGEHFTVSGVPVSLEGAIDLWKRDTYQFQRWAIETIDGFVSPKQTADHGIDGDIYFNLGNQLELERMTLEVNDCQPEAGSIDLVSGM